LQFILVILTQLSCLLRPKSPVAREGQNRLLRSLMIQSEGERLLVFEARFVSDEPDDQDRMFALNYYLTDKTIAVFEKKTKERAGGRFLAKMKVNDPATGKPYDDSAFYVGAEIAAAGRVFELVNAPEYTLCQLEANADRFPVADLQNAVNSLSGAIGKEALETAFKSKDPKGTGKITADQAKAILYGYVPSIVKQTAITILRRFTDGPTFNYEELVGYL